MTTSAIKGFGTKLYRGGSGTPKTGGTLVEEVFSFDLPEALAHMTEVTSHDSAKGEHIATYVDEGEVTIQMYYSAATGQELVRADLGGAATAYYINLAGATSKQLDFSAIVSSFKPDAPMDGPTQATAKMKITGAVTFTAQS